ncbi:hypothetical protein H6F67_09110 [Microcoleus sp. FACHB-1515]|uniref:hypothetical protein n=1 Tax=Cyanophyceae TaxID=3028117 RepID=UPI00168596E4|nr:hypothetical protein [Microcoleus sp. FACHB-1515]MBD2090010.1 hypothetical protein [Microcoleus sp. FACHB-1515]
MISIGDFVQNQKTGRLGRVIGYGHQILNNVYETTLKVQLEDNHEIAEDLFSAWTVKP